MRLIAGLLLGASLVSTGHSGRAGWTLAQARQVLASRAFAVTDHSQPDAPEYELVFTRERAGALRPAGKPSHGRWQAFAFAGVGHDSATDADIRVRFVLTSGG